MCTRRSPPSHKRRKRRPRSTESHNAIHSTEQIALSNGWLSDGWCLWRFPLDRSASVIGDSLVGGGSSQRCRWWCGHAHLHLLFFGRNISSAESSRYLDRSRLRDIRSHRLLVCDPILPSE